ncbi:YfcC family protein [Vibrio aestuarianus]|uniref:YfcC family protein n=1 Tax=Vibrio aestuarianus TaxID=28171 RepID=UPI00237C8F7A|nr:YfcC family protein [Vibrio aestuarianus]MDE1230070.1 YfcC family protein [Vibrio aestuarianus]
METKIMDSVPKKTFKMPTVYTILFAIIAMIAALTWVVPAGKYDYKTADTQQLITAQEASSYSGGERLLPIPGTYTELESSPQGVIDVLMAPIKGFHKAADVALFVLVIGGFLAITMKTGAMDAGVSAVVNKFGGREQLLIPILMFLFAIGGSTYGMAEETVAFWALILPVMAAAGYDRMVTAGVILLGSGIGVLASTVNPFATGIASRFTGLQIGDGIILRLIMLAIFFVVSVVFVMRYAARSKADPEKSALNGVEFEDDLTNEVKALEFTPARKMTMAVFFGTFMVMVYGVVPWEDMGINAMPTLWWWFDELSTLFFSAAILVALINRMPESDFIKTFLEGARDLIGVALVVAVARGIYVVMGDGAIIDTILHWAEGLVSGLPSGVFVVVTYYVHIVLSFFIPSTSGLATVSMPLMGPLADFSNVGRDLVITAYQSATGWINMFSPTSSHLIAGLALARIPYGRFFKWVMPFIGTVFVITSIILFIFGSMS